jgi:trimeric autotransporter adhesin
MRKDLGYLSFVALFLFTIQGYAQNVAINEDASAPNPNAILDIKSDNKGILIPRISTTARLAIPNTKGLLVYDTTANSFFYNTGSSWQNMVAVAGNSWALTGNNGTDSTNFLGTTDGKPLVIKVKNQRSGLIDSARALTFLGYQSGGLFLSGPGGGANNTAIGAKALSVNTTGINNTVTGAFAMQFNSSGANNTANGAAALFTNAGDYNVAIGSHTMLNNGTGGLNTAIGSLSLESNSSGKMNTCVGTQTLSSNESGNNNTAIGYFADVQGNVNNSTAIGSLAVTAIANKVRIGNSSVTSIEGAVPFTTPSDARFKFKIQDDVKGLDFILQLRPVTYQFNTKQFDEQLNNGSIKNAAFAAAMNTMNASYTEATGIRRTGFIAQEVEKAAIAAGYNFSGLIKPKTDKEYYSLSYESFVVPLVKAVQEQQQTIAGMQKEIAELKQLLKLSK